jgi:hypothetical protein
VTSSRSRLHRRHPLLRMHHYDRNALSPSYILATRSLLFSVAGAMCSIASFTDFDGTIFNEIWSPGWIGLIFYMSTTACFLLVTYVVTKKHDGGSGR